MIAPVSPQRKLIAWGCVLRFYHPRAFNKVEPYKAFFEGPYLNDPRSYAENEAIMEKTLWAVVEIRSILKVSTGLNAVARGSHAVSAKKLCADLHVCVKISMQFYNAALDAAKLSEEFSLGSGNYIEDCRYFQEKMKNSELTKALESVPKKLAYNGYLENACLLAHLRDFNSQ